MESGVHDAGSLRHSRVMHFVPPTDHWRSRGACRCSIPFEAKERPGEPGGAPNIDVDERTSDDQRAERHRIRCPLCMWVPKPSSRWACYCGCSFHTFDTGARCPDCGFRYEQTMCLDCHKWSKHRAWYTDEPAS